MPPTLRTPWGDAAALRERRLYPGSGTPPEEVARNQRERCFAAAVAVAAEKGYEAMTVADILELSGVSRSAFYVHFANKAECLTAAAEELIELGPGGARSRPADRAEAGLPELSGNAPFPAGGGAGLLRRAARRRGGWGGGRGPRLRGVLGAGRGAQSGGWTPSAAAGFRQAVIGGRAEDDSFAPRAWRAGRARGAGGRDLGMDRKREPPPGALARPASPAGRRRRRSRRRRCT